MRILQFIPSLDANVGGPARAVLDLSAALAMRGVTMTVATCDPGQAPSAWRVHRSDCPHLLDLRAPILGGIALSPRQRCVLRSAIETHDVVHLHGVWELANVQIAQIAQHLGIPYVVSPRGMLARWSMQQNPIRKSIFLKLLGPHWLDSAAHIHFTAEAERDDAVRWLPPNQPSSVIPNLLDLDPFQHLPDVDQRRHRLRASDFTVLFLSRIHPKKGLDLLIQACALLKRENIAVHLIVAGDGQPQYVAQLQALAGRCGLTHDDIEFAGTVTGRQKLALYRSCDLLALPTQQENFGFVFIEALACGLPIVTTAVDLHKELERSGAVTVIPRTVEDFRSAIHSLHGHRDSLPATGERARAWVFEAFSAERIAIMFEHMYAGVATRSTHPHERKLQHSASEA